MLTLKRYTLLKDLVLLTIAMFIGSLGWAIFLLPNHITTGGIPGLASILYWGWNIPVQVTFLGVNALLLLIALKVLGWQFCLKTLYAAVMFTLFSALGQHWMEGSTLLQGQPFMAIVLGAASLGSTVGLGLASNASTGGTDVVAAMINKYHDISLGKLILLVDISIVTASYVALRNWEEVIYGYVFLFIFSICVDKVVNMMHQSVQFFIISEKYEQRSWLLFGARGEDALCLGSPNGVGQDIFYHQRDRPCCLCFAEFGNWRLRFGFRQVQGQT